MQSDESLMRRIQARDPGAFDALFARYADRVRRRIDAIVRSTASSEDLTQEVFLRLWTRAEQWCGAGSVAGWLVRIGTNLALNHLRHRRRHPQQSLDTARAEAGAQDEPPAWIVDESADSPADLAERAERLERLRAAFDALPAAKLAVMRMVHEQQMDIRAVARELGVPEGTVKSRLHYAVRWLARELKDQGEDP
jgi:RNA polymerase sigma-70 factor (ECF subfamily)